MSATSTRHACALAESISKDFHVTPQHMEGYPKGEWVLIDIDDVVVHIFHEPIRIVFNLDKLWAHVPEVSIDSLADNRRTATTRPRSRA